MRGPQWHFLFPKGFRSYADQHPEAPFCPWPVLSELPDFPDENCLFWIRLNLVS